MRDVWIVVWRELLLLRNKLPSFIASCLVGPLLYLMSFGWGLGRSIKFGTTSYLDFVVPGILAMSAMNGSFNASGTSLAFNRFYYRMLEEFFVSPISVWSLALGNVLAGCVRGMLSSGIVLVCAYFFGSRLHLGFWLFVSLLLTCFLFSSLGLVAAMIIKYGEEIFRIGTFMILPMSFLCGTFFSLDKYPKAIAIFIEVLPLTHSALSLRALALDTGFPALSLVVLLAYAVLLFGLGFWAIMREE